MIHFSRFTFSPVIALPSQFEVFDFTQGYDAERTLRTPYGIGKYNEKRKNMYTTELFNAGANDARDIHIGIDIAAPVNTPVHSFFDGEIFLFGYNGAEGDYGHTLILKYVLDGTELYALYGHLSAKSLAGKSAGQKVKSGEIIAWLGAKHENGGWNPHLHFQLSYARPAVCDMPGVVADKDREEALRTYPDPRLVLGNLY